MSFHLDSNIFRRHNTPPRKRTHRNRRINHVEDLREEKHSTYVHRRVLDSRSDSLDKPHRLIRIV